MADEKFSVSGVKGRMTTIQSYFNEFASTLDGINGFIQANVNASLGSSAFGELGGKLLAIWDHNAATFGDFNRNFDEWAQVVAIIAANNSTFAVDASATYRDTAGSLAGVKEAREIVAKNNGMSNIASHSNYGGLNDDAKRVIDDAYRIQSMQVTENNVYGGRTVAFVNALGALTEIFYDADGTIIGKKVTDKDGKEKFYDGKNTEIPKLPTPQEVEKEKEDAKKKAAEEEEEKKKKEEEEKNKTLTRQEFTDEIFDAGRSQTGVPYDSMRYGPEGSDVEGFGCAMFVSYCYNQVLFNGVSGQNSDSEGFYGSCMNYWGNVTKDGFDAHNKGFVEVSAEDALPTDIVCFVEKGKTGDYYGEASNCFHVGLYEGDGKMMHSSKFVTNGVGECKIDDYLAVRGKDCAVKYLRYVGPGVEAVENNN